MALERDLSTLLSLSSSLSSIFLALTEAVWADLFPPAPNFFSCWLIESGKRRSRDETMIKNGILRKLEQQSVGRNPSFTCFFVYVQECQRNRKKNKIKNYSQWPPAP